MRSEGTTSLAFQYFFLSSHWRRWSDLKFLLSLQIFHQMPCTYKDNTYKDLANDPDAYEKYVKPYKVVYDKLTNYTGRPIQNPQDVHDLYLILCTQVSKRYVTFYNAAQWNTVQELVILLWELYPFNKTKTIFSIDSNSVYPSRMTSTTLFPAGRRKCTPNQCTELVLWRTNTSTMTSRPWR